ncbi:phage Gp37/Gp68 family protein [Mycolicibacterium senegalense]|uniref:phage Gp37/Gp68 family protein n=1 Tax=Mycolicibacterium senegalense TaxID=1796 RepID=UPI003AAAD8C9
MTATNISWTQEVWNWLTGCDAVSSGCEFCYAMVMAKRLKTQGHPKYQSDGDPRTSGPGFGVAVHDEVMLAPTSWRIPKRVFVNSMSDVGHPRVPRRALARSWAVQALTGRHDYQVLTKRPKRLARILNDPEFVAAVAEEATDIMANMAPHRGRWRLNLVERPTGGGWTTSRTEDGGTLWAPPWPLPNTWVGTTIESDEYSYRADLLRSTPAAVRWLSVEPMLGPLPSLDLTSIDWVVVGGESGPQHRHFDLGWARDIRDRCVEQGIPFYFKQIGGRTTMANGRQLDGRTWDEYPLAAQRGSSGTRKSR